MSRILEILRRTLEKELAEHGRKLDPAAPMPLLDGPWGLLLTDGGAWDNSARLDTNLYSRLRGTFSDNVSREILLAAAGVKISRTCLPDSKLELLRGIAAEHDFQVVASAERYIHGRDRGKGG